MSYYHYLATGILLLTMAIATLRILAGEQKGWPDGHQYLDCGTSGGVYGLSVDTVLWLVVQVAQYLSVPPFSGTRTRIPLQPAQIHTLAQLVPSMDGCTGGGPGAGHFVKMVHNGVSGIMQAYAEGFNISQDANLGSKYVKEGDAEVAPMENPADYQYDIDCVEVG